MYEVMGLDYFNARYYSPAQGRFTSPDPGNAGADPPNPQTWNMYAYVNNSPTNYTDPDGTGILSWLGTIIGSFLGGPIGAIAGWGAGTAGEAVLWGPGSNIGNGLPSLGSLAGCGGPLGNCGSINQPTWNEDMLGPKVQDSGGLIKNINPSDPPTGFSYGWLWLHGLLPQRIYYPANSQGTRDMRRSSVVQNIRRAYIQGGCRGYVSVGSGHAEPWKESARNGVFTNTTQFEVGGFVMQSVTSQDGAITSHTIRNTTGWSSLAGFSTWGRALGFRGNELDLTRGPGRNVEQVFTWSEPNPCQ